MQYPVTPDGRYFLVKGRLWRCTNPALHATTREKLVKQLMAARRALKTVARDKKSLKEARSVVHQVKEALGERGPVWWNDGAPDYSRKLAKNTPYAAWARVASHSPN